MDGNQFFLVLEFKDSFFLVEYKYFILFGKFLGVMFNGEVVKFFFIICQFDVMGSSLLRLRDIESGWDDIVVVNDFFIYIIGY